MIIALIHPSRGRAKKAFQTYQYWMRHISHAHTIKYYLSIDLSDPELSNYKKWFKDHIFSILINDNTNLVEATNNAAKEARGDILVYLSDDFMCPQNWDEFIVTSMIERIHEPCVLKVNDCLQKFEIPMLTIPIVTKHLFRKLGYFFNPIYKSQFCDTDLYHTCKNQGWIINAPNLKFEHRHYSIGLSEKDEINERNDKNHDSGNKIFIQRQIENFPI